MLNSSRLFLTEGIATVLFGVVIWFLLPDCRFFLCTRMHILSTDQPLTRNILLVPETANWLTDREKKFIQARLPPNAPRANEQNFNFREIIESLKDLRLWLFTLIWATFTVGTNGLTFFQSTVIANLGFT